MPPFAMALDVEVWIGVCIFVFIVVGFIEWMRYRDSKVEPAAPKHKPSGIVVDVGGGQVLGKFSKEELEKWRRDMGRRRQIDKDQRP